MSGKFFALRISSYDINLAQVHFWWDFLKSHEIHRLTFRPAEAEAMDNSFNTQMQGWDPTAFDFKPFRAKCKHPKEWTL